MIIGVINVKPGQCPLVVYFTQVHQPLALIKNKEKRKTRFALKVGVVTHFDTWHWNQHVHKGYSETDRRAGRRKHSRVTANH